MKNEKLMPEIKAFVLEYFEKEGVELGLDTPIFENFGADDPDRFAEFLEDFSRKFRVKVNQIDDVDEYIRNLKRKERYHFSDTMRRLTKAPKISVAEITLSDLASIAAKQCWPDKYYL